MFTNLKTLNHDDAAENSIMQTITIAVSAILIAAGLVTAPGLINNARDNNATTDLANIAYAEEFQQGTTGKYVADYSKLSADGIKLTPSSTKLVIYAGDNCYAAFAESKSGKIFYRVSGSAQTKQITDFSVRPAGYPASCAFPSSASEVGDSAQLNKLLSQAVVNESNLTGDQHKIVALKLSSDKGYTVSSSWKYGSSFQTTLGGSELIFKAQAVSYRAISLLGSGGGWLDTTSLDTPIPGSEQSKGQWSTTVVGSGKTSITTPNGAKSVNVVPTRDLDQFEVNGYTAGTPGNPVLTETIGDGKIYKMLVWDRALTSDEQDVINRYLASTAK